MNMQQHFSKVVYSLILLATGAASLSLHAQTRVDAYDNRQVRNIGQIEQHQHGIGQSDTIEIDNSNAHRAHAARVERQRMRRDERRAEFEVDTDGNERLIRAERGDGRKAFVNENGQMVIERDGRQIVINR
jgi:hypothetical protein